MVSEYKPHPKREVTKLKVDTIIQVNETNLAETGCFCLRSKPKSDGYQNKNDWLMKQFQDGLQYIKIMDEDKVAGFIEYTPIEHSSRVVYGENYIVIHCLWVQLTGKGHATTLIQQCIAYAKRENKAGVIVVTNEETSWTPGKDVFLKNGFEEIAQAPYGFALLVYKLDATQEEPCFPDDWEERLERFDDLTILRTYQCPFVDVATDNVVLAANKLGLPVEVIDFQSRTELLELSPTPYGIYGVIYKQKLIGYHRLTAHSALKRLKEVSLSD